MTWDVVVVGAGVCGLAAAYELARRDARVLVVERSGVGAEQSAGLARIFRVAHADPRLCALAVEAHGAWRRWEGQLGAGRLLGAEGLVVASPDAPQVHGRAMAAAGAEAVELDAADAAARLPAAAPSVVADGALLDPCGGAIRVRRTLQALAARVEVAPGAAVAAEDHGDAAALRLADGTVLRAGRVLLCAGTETPVLAATAGIALPATFTHHVRLTYRLRDGVDPGSCLITRGAYGLPLGRTGLFGLGLDDPGEPAPHRTADADAFAEAVRDQHAGWIPRNLPGVQPEPVDEVRCVSVQAPWLDDHDDGFAALRAGRVVAFTGGNLMKFGPLLGDRLARTVLAEDGVHGDLAP